MRGFSKAIITGNLTRDPELRTTTSGSSVCSFSVAVNRTFKGNDGENKEEVSYIDCVAWGKLGEVIAQYAKKGSSVLVSGRLSQRSFEGKDGVKRSRTEIVAEDFNFIGANPASRDGGSYNSSSSNASNTETSASVDIPTDIPEGEVDLSEIPF
ncbi:single-stranded DNA-binding protein [Candidatus Saccharibacteria bacterium]|nr:single-stranded DNA-binding protein [Candidatus Saccharibacteria bacterium]